MLNYLDRMIAEGFGRAALVGALSTGLVGGGAGTVIGSDPRCGVRCVRVDNNRSRGTRCRTRHDRGCRAVDDAGTDNL
ncbi:hypothetical protein LCGC14_2979480, partial [marine sediment metagenome]